ncbi:MULTISPECIES: alpha/beta fold hydrolase BchO [Rhizobium/Agrobacterium group]|uniref:alpha/beta fold hydrolase BchO n=1 Tax=Rhizobium/Agrobacterium group TaxID=227290 RepID=UPI0006B9864B|nr:MULTISPECIES: alpha/beta fold hydrolase BchO [Rhizobium/Agrobacterium group]KPF61229.1 magnesium chelatase [Rhizobium sp. AAP116]QGG91851.1 alpha/beta fold hydrolase [Agrobacterium sp. MA01]
MTLGRDRLNWETDGRNWPNRSASQFVKTNACDWHVQIAGQDTAPMILLLHGTGASSHSWRHLLPLLSARFRVVAPDLPGHGFTRPCGPTDPSLPGMVRALTELVSRLDRCPAVILGHSAGAAIAVTLAASKASAVPRHVIGINGAYLPIRGNALFSPLAKALFANPFSASMFSLMSRVTPLGGNLLTATGSPIDEEGRAIYRMLLASPAHVRGALGMMAAWDLSRFDATLQRLPFPMTLIAAKDDPMVPIENSSHAARQAPGSRLVLTDTGGHLLHECRPADVVRWLDEAIGNQRPNGADAA